MDESKVLAGGIAQQTKKGGEMFLNNGMIRVPFQAGYFPAPLGDNK